MINPYAPNQSEVNKVAGTEISDPIAKIEENLWTSSYYCFGISLIFQSTLLFDSYFAKSLSVIVALLLLISFTVRKASFKEKLFAVCVCAVVIICVNLIYNASQTGVTLSAERISTARSFVNPLLFLSAAVSAYTILRSRFKK